MVRRPKKRIVDLTRLVKGSVTTKTGTGNTGQLVQQAELLQEILDQLNLAAMPPEEAKTAAAARGQKNRFLAHANDGRSRVSRER